MFPHAAYLPLVNMKGNRHVMHTPPNAIGGSLLAIATGLRETNGSLVDPLALSANAACKNAITLLCNTSPLLEKLVLTCGPFAVLFYGIYQYAWKSLEIPKVYQHFCSRFISKITIPGDHALHRQVVSWFSAHGVRSDTRSLIVYGQSICPNPAPGDTSMEDMNTLSYIPAVGASRFSFAGHSLLFERTEPKEVQLFGAYGERLKDCTRTKDSDITISNTSFFGGVAPIKAFLEHVCARDNAKQEATTSIHRVSRYVNDGETWELPVVRPSRNLDSVTMDSATKDSVVQDVRAYLSKETKRWYASRGIPWRRGILLYGPPGTGKTSFCTALAGHFELPVYIISLSNCELRDNHLETLFDSIPEKALVLLEDIDSAGIRREAMAPSTENGTEVKTSGLTLAGILNVIDGVTSQEGRLLIMTSNAPDTLDPALIRPGRIDRKILFGNASREVMEKLFVHIYSDVPGETANGLQKEHNLVALSKDFAAKMPKDQLTPAEIQSFLLVRRESPVQAVADV